MPISEHLNTFAGFRVEDYDPERGLQDVNQTIYRVRTDPDSTPPPPPPRQQSMLSRLFGSRSAPVPPPPPPKPSNPLESLLQDPKAGQLQGLVYGAWMEDFDNTLTPENIVSRLASSAESLPSLKALFIGDMTYEECEISWITQSDVSPLLHAFSGLEHFGVRGSNELTIGPVRHVSLKTLVIQCGGLPAKVLDEVCKSEFPSLEHLELWLGEANYGADIAIDDLKPILSGALFPKLRYLGLRDSEMADQVAAAVAQSPMIHRIKVLDLSLGNLSDAGAQALLASPAVAKLERLDIHHHYITPAVVSQLSRFGPDVDASEPHDDADEDSRYISVGE